MVAGGSAENLASVCRSACAGQCIGFWAPGIFLGIALTSLCCAILLQIGVNLANDYFDFKSGWILVSVWGRFGRPNRA